MWWPKEKHNDSIQSKNGTRTKSLPQKTKGSPFGLDWSPVRRTPALTTLRLDSDLSLPAFPPLPNAFPSPTKEVEKEKSRRNALSPLKTKRRPRSRPGTSAGIVGRGALHQAALRGELSQDLRNAAFLARGADWISSKATKAAAARPASAADAPSISWTRHQDLVSRRKNRSSSLPNTVRTPEKEPPEKDHDATDILKIRHALNLPKEVMSQACDLFRRHAESVKDGSELLRDRLLTKSGFAKVWHEMTHQDVGVEICAPSPVVKQAFRHAGKPHSSGLDLGQFALWYSSNYFCENVSLSPDRQKLRKIARKHSMHHTDVENYQQIFSSFDKDKSGTIDAAEFEQLLCKCTKVPDSIGLPPARVRHLWQIADEDGNQEMNFEEFLSFYEKYLGTDSTGFEDFYRIGNHPSAALSV
jgi:hypothetical protein